MLDVDQPVKNHLCIHGHFYQPPREDPFTGEIPSEYGAAPYHDFNEKINAECYRPNAARGNFAHISFDLGPTLASWLGQHDPETHQAMLGADRQHCVDTGAGNALAQAYNHTIMPLASAQEKRIQIAWGLADFRYRFGRDAEGMWLPETAVDYPTLSALADYGIQFTILAPWQAAGDVDTSQPSLVRLPDGRHISVFFYNAALSGAVSFDGGMTIDAPAFSYGALPRHLNQQKLAAGEPQILLVATDGELYGHHQPFRDLFLQHLLTEDAPRDGFAVVSLAEYLRRYPPTHEVGIREGTSWSCAHGVTRWRESCGCSGWNGDWKWHLRHALNRLAARLDLLYEMRSADDLYDPWAALEGYLAVRLGTTDWSDFWSRHARRMPGGAASRRLKAFFEAQYARHLMFTSCAFFFEDFDRIEPRNAVAWARRAVACSADACGVSLETGLLRDLAAVKSWRSGLDASGVYAGIAGQRRPVAAAVSPHAAQHVVRVRGRVWVGQMSGSPAPPPDDTVRHNRSRIALIGGKGEGS